LRFLEIQMEQPQHPPEAREDKDFVTRWFFPEMPTATDTKGSTQAMFK
jgi:hypothetical protein